MNKTLTDKRVKKETYGIGKTIYTIEYVYKIVELKKISLFNKIYGNKNNTIERNVVEKDNIEFDNLDEAITFAKLSQGPVQPITINIGFYPRLYRSNGNGSFMPKYEVYKLCDLTSIYKDLDIETLTYDEIERPAYIVIDTSNKKRYYTIPDTDQYQSCGVITSFLTHLEFHQDELAHHKAYIQSISDFVNIVAREEAIVFKNNTEILAKIAEIEKHKELDDLLVSTDYISVGIDDNTSTNIIREYEMSQEELQALANERNKFIIDEINRINATKNLLISLIK